MQKQQIKKSMILIENFGSGHAVASVEDGVITDFVADPKNDSNFSFSGNIMAVKVDAPVNGTNGTFVTLPNKRKGFLKGKKKIPVGTIIVATQVGNVEKEKALPLSQNITIKGRYVILAVSRNKIKISRSIKSQFLREEMTSFLLPLKGKLPANYGFVLRSMAGKVTEEKIFNEAKSHINFYNEIREKKFSKPKILHGPVKAKEYAFREWSVEDPVSIVEGDGCFDLFGVWEQISEYLSERVNLKNGGVMIIEPTAAFVAIDINTGSDLGKSASMTTNLNAAKEIPRQLRIRGLGGTIIIDFAPLKKLDRSKIEILLKERFLEDNIKTNLVGWTTLGNLEIQRKKEKLPIINLLATDPNRN